MNEEEIMHNGLLIDKCKEEGIMIALLLSTERQKKLNYRRALRIWSTTLTITFATVIEVKKKNILLKK